MSDWVEVCGYESIYPDTGVCALVGDRQVAGARLTLRLVTGMNQACGTKVTPWEVDKTKPKGMRKFRPPTIKNDGNTNAMPTRVAPRMR